MKNLLKIVLYLFIIASFLSAVFLAFIHLSFYRIKLVADFFFLFFQWPFQIKKLEWCQAGMKLVETTSAYGNPLKK